MNESLYPHILLKPVVDYCTLHKDIKLGYNFHQKQSEYVHTAVGSPPGTGDHRHSWHCAPTPASSMSMIGGTGTRPPSPCSLFLLATIGNRTGVIWTWLRCVQPPHALCVIFLVS
jgi:hypothetical protein